MSTLNLKIKNFSRLNCFYLIDGKEIQMKRNKYNNLIYTLETTKEEVKLEIFTVHEMEGPLWLLMATIFYIISIFGIFGKKYDKYCRSMKYSAVISLQEDANLELTFDRFVDGEPAIETTGECSKLSIETNQYFINQDCKKRLKIFKFVKIGLWLLLILVVVLIVVKIIIGG